jgi:hypothetical protein
MMKSRYYLYLAVSILTLGVSGVLHQSLSNSPKKIKIPKPQEAAGQAEKLNPEEITQIEVDEQISDRLNYFSDVLRLEYSCFVLVLVLPEIEAS